LRHRNRRIVICEALAGAAIVAVRTSRARPIVVQVPFKVEHLAFSPSGDVLAIAGRGLALRSMQSGELRCEEERAAVTIAFVGSSLVEAVGRDEVRVRRPEGEVMFRLDEPGAAARERSLAASGALLALNVHPEHVPDEGEVHVWNLGSSPPRLVSSSPSFAPEFYRSRRTACSWCARPVGRAT
jgi:hypothetical protein